jgi:pyruvate dehydrogenase E2 component (dihydrolipoamide acetyltransferase)
VNTDSTFLLPDVGEGLVEAEIVQWLVSEGDTVVVDQPVVTVQTGKALVDLPTPYAGAIIALAAPEGATVEVGKALFTVRESGPAGTQSLPPASGVDRFLASPSTRRLARELGVDLSVVTPTGPGARILATDVAAAATGGAPAPSASSEAGAVAAPAALTQGVASAEPGGNDERLIPLRGLRREIANSMTVAWQVPHITEFREVDATALLAVHARLRLSIADAGRKLTFLPFFLRACAAALRRHPRFNASLDLENSQIIEHGQVNIGVATASPDGLLVPVVRDADELSLLSLVQCIDNLTSAARTRTATREDLSGGTFTVTNFGSFGTWLGTPVIRPPEGAIAGFGRISDRVVAVDGQPAVRKTLPIVVAADHRLNDGADLAAFINEIAAYVSDPVRLATT